MRNRGASGKQAGEERTADYDRDRYPTAKNALSRVAEHPDLFEGPVEFVELRCLANGEVVFRTRAPRAEETEGGVSVPE